MSANTPPGLSTRANSATASSVANQWNACAAKTPSTDASASGRSSAEPVWLSAAGTTCSRIAAHPVERLDREHARVAPREHARQLPGAGPHVDDSGLGPSGSMPSTASG